MRSALRRVMLVTVPLWLAGQVSPARGQVPLAPIMASGQTVTPAFEGWYRNPDGSYSISFGYYNRNAEEVLEIPIGSDNFVAPGEPNQGQPTHFRPRRHWGVFAVKVPADFGNKTITWTLKVRGETFAIPASLHPDWEIDALAGEAGSGNTPPVLRFVGGLEGRGPGGATAGPLPATVGKPLPLVVWASDDGKSAPSIASAGRQGVRVSLTWFKHQGTGDVVFSQVTPAIDSTGKATTSATFDRPGVFMLRLRANDASGVANAGHAQCCWTNSFVKVSVTP